MEISRFEFLYKTYQPGLVNFAFFYLKNEQEAIDIVQELFMNIWEKKEDFTIDENPKAYLMIAVRNRCYNRLNRNNVEYNQIDNLADVFISQENISADIETKELEKTIREFVNTLPEKCKEIFILSRYEHLSYKEIATILGLSVKTVENQIGNALKMLRKNLR